MGQKPNRRNHTRFTASFSERLGRLWQEIPRMGKRSSVNQPAPRHPGGQLLPPPWETAASGGTHRAYRSFKGLQQRFRLAPGRTRVGVLAGAGGLLLISVIGVVVLCAHMPSIINGAPATGSANKHGTPLTTASTTPAGPFAIAFTCASGTIRGSGQLCVHTQANAILRLTVRYCDGSYAESKSLRGSAHANGSGDYTWHWSVRTRCAGTATATVEAKSAGQSVTQSTTFTIAR